jgi:hypothetical protein
VASAYAIQAHLCRKLYSRIITLFIYSATTVKFINLAELALSALKGTMQIYNKSYAIVELLIFSNKGWRVFKRRNYRPLPLFCLKKGIRIA